MKFEYIPENDFEKTLVEHFQEDFQEELKNRRSTLNTEERILMLEEMLMKNQTAVVMENRQRHIDEVNEKRWGAGSEEEQ